MGKRDEKVGRREGEKGPPKHLAWDPRGLNPALKITTQQQWHRWRADKLSSAASARRSTKVGGAHKLSAAAARRGRRTALHCLRTGNLFSYNYVNSWCSEKKSKVKIGLH